MSGAFDPYHRWLGIPPKHQPPNHYRLLGLELFESDPEVIRDAADGRMAHVRTYQLGEYSELSQRILNELAVAKSCLGNPRDKAAYDTALKRRHHQLAKTAVSVRSSKALPSSANVPGMQGSFEGESDRTLSEGAISELLADDGASASGSMETPSPAVSHEISSLFSGDLPQGAVGGQGVIRQFHQGRQTTKSGRFLRKKLWIVGGLSGLAWILLIGAIAIFWGKGEPREVSASSQKNVTLADSQDNAAANKVSKEEESQNSNLPGSSSESKSDSRENQIVPRLSYLEDQVVREGQQVVATAKVINSFAFPGTFRFLLADGAPSGAIVNEKSGEFAWAPSLNQIPGEYPITIRAVIAGNETIAGSVTFKVITQKKVVLPLRIRTIPLKTVEVGCSIILFPEFSEPVEPSCKVVFSLSQAPAWAVIDSHSGRIVCFPPVEQSPGSYSMTVCVQDASESTRKDSKTFVVKVIPKNSQPAPTPVQSAPASSTPVVPATVQTASVAAVSVKPNDDALKITLLSGAVLSAKDFELQQTLQKTMDDLMARCFEELHGQGKRNDAIGLFQKGSDTTISVLCGLNIKEKEPNGPAVFFHNTQDAPNIHSARSNADNIRVYANYRNGTWDGLLVVWDKKGDLEYWGNYLRGQRNGPCCLFDNDILKAIFECERGKLTAVHMIQGNDIARSLTDIGAAKSDDVAGPLIKKFDETEQLLKAENRTFQADLKKEIQQRVGAINQGKLDAALQRLNHNRQMEWELQEKMKRGGK